MSTKRKLKGGSIPQAKHRYSLTSKSKFNPFELENHCLRFPLLCDKILDQLNPQSLATAKGLSKFWYDQINESRTYWIRKIQIYTQDFIQYKEEWAIFETKTSLKFLKALAKALYIFRIYEESDYWKKCKTLLIYNNFLAKFKMESDDQWSPLHIGAKYGSQNLFKEISLRFQNINPANNNGETPLHCATKSGHLTICKFIIENIHDKNPADKIGFTPLHYAAMNDGDLFDNVELYDLIVQNVENKNLSIIVLITCEKRKSLKILILK